MASRPSSTSASKLGPALLFALAWLVLLDAWVAWRLPALVHEDSIEMYLELSRRVEAFSAPERVQVLVFGNSHALAGLRPPQLAAAMGLPDDAVFSFALPSCSPRELGQFVDRLAPHFPKARLALANLDPSLPLTNRWHIPRGLFLTRDDPRGRWQYALESADDWPGRLGVAMTLPCPLVEFAPQLREVARAHPKLTLESLVALRDGPLPLSPQAAIARAPWRWGYPPPWYVGRDDATRAAIRRRLRTPKERWIRARQLTRELPASLPDGFADLAAAEARLGQRGVAMTWVGMPVDPQLTATMRALAPAAVAAYARAQQAFLAAPGRRGLPAPAGFVAGDFLDLDHLNTAGSQRLAAAIGPRLAGELRVARRPRATSAASRPPGPAPTTPSRPTAPS